MERRDILRPVLFLITLFFAVWLIGCASTGASVQGEQSSGDIADIDELLGLTDQTSSEGTSEDIAEDDVLRLLGVVEETSDSTERAGVRESDLQNQVEDLEKQNQALAQEQQSLLGQLSNQQQEISTFESGTGGAAAPERESTSPTWKSSSFQDRYQEARQDYTARRYRDAIQKFQNLLTMNMKHSLSDNCQYWIGESYYGLGDYRQAIVAFEKVFSYPDSNKDADAQLKLGICYMRLNETSVAKQEFRKLVDNYPTSEYVNVAKRYINQME